MKRVLSIIAIMLIGLSIFHPANILQIPFFALIENANNLQSRFLGGYEAVQHFCCKKYWHEGIGVLLLCVYINK